MLQKNPLQPPRPSAPREAAAPGPAPCHRAAALPGAADFDRTGILAGIDPCESRYWWLPELYGPEEMPTSSPAVRATQALATRLRTPGQAARDVPPRSTAAA